VSYLVAIAAERYLDELLHEERNRHNYAMFTHYTIGQRAEGGTICWELYWGNPDFTIKGIGNRTKIYRCTSAPSAL
jgi:hypothetical protein